MDNYIVLFGPIELAVQGEDGSSCAIVCPVDVNLDIGPRLDTFAKSFLLFGIVVATTASDEECTDGLEFRFLAECGRIEKGAKYCNGNEQWFHVRRGAEGRNDLLGNSGSCESSCVP